MLSHAESEASSKAAAAKRGKFEVRRDFMGRDMAIIPWLRAQEKATAHYMVTTARL
jgi:hypothetical protein